MPSTLDPNTILGKAIQAVPAVRYALGVAGVIAVIAIVRSWKIDTRIAIFGFIVMIALMTILAVFSRINTAGAALKTPLMVLVWSSVILFVATSMLLFTKSFFDWPKPLHDVPKPDVKSDGGQVKPGDKNGSDKKSKEDHVGDGKGKPVETNSASMSAFLGHWESDEMEEGRVKNDRNQCMQDAIKKLYLDIFKQTPTSVGVTFRSVISSQAHMSTNTMVDAATGLPVCQGGIPYQKEDSYKSSIVGISGNVLSIQMASPTETFVAQFKLLKGRLSPMPGGFDHLVNNTNIATFVAGDPLAFSRRY